MEKTGYVYILSNGFKRLYIGVPSQLEIRVWRHKNPEGRACFTSKYAINRLVYFERFTSMSAAIAREKELKGWTRIKKIALIVATNPTWKDLSAAWGEPIGPWTAEFEKRVPDEYKRFSPKSEKQRKTSTSAGASALNTGILRSAQNDNP